MRNALPIITLLPAGATKASRAGDNAHHAARLAYLVLIGTLCLFAAGNLEHRCSYRRRICSLEAKGCFVETLVFLQGMEMFLPGRSERLLDPEPRLPFSPPLRLCGARTEENRHRKRACDCAGLCQSAPDMLIDADKKRQNTTLMGTPRPASPVG